ncbi:hypothetical protein [Methylobacterium nodulans]|nr:hypothetical protein [Methylobacterium nodulans]
MIAAASWLLCRHHPEGTDLSVHGFAVSVMAKSRITSQHSFDNPR